ncbi:hypothetical protein [Nonomuraea sp. NPDC048901]|uniref:hypothetical protein n=1 Tax=Nonomuraea sp. NPDC048901 TaxID=3155627 RepID=UPI0033F69200
MLGCDARADGHAWHLPAAPAVTGRELLDLVIAELGQPGRTAALGRPMPRLIGLFNPTVRAFGETWYQRDRPFVSDASKFVTTFGPFTATPHAVARRRHPRLVPRLPGLVTGVSGLRRQASATPPGGEESPTGNGRRSPCSPNTRPASPPPRCRPRWTRTRP